MTDDKIAEIRKRHNHIEETWWTPDDLDANQAHADRATLLAEVEKLRAENARLRAQVAEYFREPETHPVEET